jgi:hypothetical protein
VLELILPDDAPIKLLHPAGCSDAVLASWRQILNDYRILQPFPQLSRPICRLPEAWKDKSEVSFSSWYNASMEKDLGARVLKLQLDPPEGTSQASRIVGISLHLPQTTRPSGAFAELDPGIMSEILFQLQD